MHSFALTFIALLFTVSISVQPLAVLAAEPIAADILPEASVVMSEIYSDSALSPEKGTSPEHEFIELYNQSSESVALASLMLVRDDDLETVETDGTMILAGGDLQPGEYRIFNPPFSLLNSGTAIELYYVSETEELLVQSVDYSADLPRGTSSLHLYDDVWKIATPATPNAAPPSEPANQIAEEPVASQPGDDEAEPPIDGGDDPVDTTDPEQPQDEVESDPTPDGTLPGQPSTCAADNVQISEIVANPAGNDKDGGEFIELYNAGDSDALLLGCGLSTDKLSAYEFDETDTIPAKRYKAFTMYDDLLNAGGTVTFVAGNYEDLVKYPPLGDDEAYALIAGAWQLTKKRTAGQTNALPTAIETVTGGLGALTPCAGGKFRNPLTNRCKSNAIATSGLRECAADQFRNPATNRCKKLGTDNSALKPCSPGQYRSPETNRCRGASLASANLKPCDAEQERNPATNRCRKTAGESSTLQACKEGYERNPDTNRCRKEDTTSGAALNGGGSSTGTGASTTGQNLAIVAIAGIFLAFFLLYEYRLTIRDWFTRAWVKPPQTS